jgi:hypothetical protein
MSESDVKSVSPPTIGFLFLVSLIAISFFFAPGTGDVGTWARWMREIDSNGLIGGYTHSDTDYPPLAFVFLATVLKCAAAFGADPFVVLKFSLFVFLLATALCFYWFTRNLILAAALELALILNSMALGYLDIYVAPCLIAAFFLLQRGHFTVGFILFALSCSIKWQPLIIAPFICFYLLKAPGPEAFSENRGLARRFLPFAISAVAIALPLFLIFGWKIFDALKRAMTYHKFLSAYGLNLCWIETWALHLLSPDKYGPLQNGMIDIFIVRDPLVVWPNKLLFYASYVAILVAFARQPKTFERLVTYSILGYLAYFVFNTSVHENHLFLVCCLAWVLVFFQPDELVRCINLCLAANANLFLFYGAFGQRLNPVIAGVDITLLFAIANICLFAGMLVQTLKTDGVSWRFWRAPAS